MFLIIAISGRFFEGIGLACVQTSLYAIAGILYPKRQLKVVAVVEMGAGVGLTLGPSVGYVMFVLTNFTGVFALQSL